MQCALEALVRGSGKIFLLVRVDGARATSRFALKVQTAEGADLPAMLLPFADEERVCPTTGPKRFAIVLAQLAVDQRLVLSEVDAAGAVVDDFSYRVTPSGATWTSRLNYRTKPALAAKLRDCDARSSVEAVAYHLMESYRGDAIETLRGRLTLPRQTTEPLRVWLLDRDGVRHDTAFVVVGDALEGPAGAPELARRSVSFTLRVPELTPGSVLFTETEQGLLLPGFIVLDDELIGRVRYDGDYRRRNASWDPAYDHWLRTHRLTERDWRLQRASRLDYEPLISIVVPLYETPLTFFYELVESVVRQTYGQWELVLVNASPDDQALSAAVAEVCALDANIVAVTLDENRGIADNTNAGVKAAHGAFIGFLDHDDLLEPDALYEYARALNADPSIDLLYCDEDLLLADGRFDRPYFKADFSIDLLRANNYMAHFLVLRKTVLDACGGLDRRYDGAQDHALILHATELTDRICHVPKLLYHWRVSAQSTAGAQDQKTYATEAGVRAVRDHLDRLGIAADVSAGRYPFTYDVRYAVAEPHPLVSILIPNKDQTPYLDRCIRSIETLTAYRPFEIVIIENNSADPATFAFYDELAARHPEVRVVRFDGAFNFSAIVNFGAAEARGDYLVLLNNDTELLTGDWLERAVGLCGRDDVGAVGVKLLYPDGTIQHEGVVLTADGPSHVNVLLPDTVPDDSHVLYMSLNVLPQERSAVTGACMIVKRSVFDEVGGFDERFAVALNDVDFCLRLVERGRRIVYTPDIRLHHFESVTRGYENTPEKRLRYRRERIRFDERWIDYFFNGDPFYNVNFNQQNQYYQLKW